MDDISPKTWLEMVKKRYKLRRLFLKICLRNSTNLSKRKNSPAVVKQTREQELRERECVLREKALEQEKS